MNLAVAPQEASPRPAMDREILMFNLALYPHLVAEAVSARRCRMIAGAAAGTAVLPAAVLVSRVRTSPGRPRDRHATDSVLGAVYASPMDTLAAATHAEPETSSGQRSHKTACQHIRGTTWPQPT